MNKILLSTLQSIIIITILASCGGSDDSPPPPEPDNTVHKLSYYDFQLAPPNVVNVIFQLSDQENIPLEMLSPSEMVVTEDGGELNSVLNDFALSQSGEFDFIPFVALLLDANSDTDSIFEDIKMAAKEVITSFPANTRIGLYTYSNSIVTEMDFTTDVAELSLAIDDLNSRNQGSNLYGAMERSIGDLQDSISFGAGRVSPGFIIAIAANEDSEGTSDIDEINTDKENINVFALTFSTALDSALVDIEGFKGVSVSSSDDISSKADELETILESFENSFYVLDYETEKEGEIEVSVSVSSLKSEIGENMDFTYTPDLFFNPDSFEIKTDDLRFISDGSRRNGEVLVRKDLRNDSVDFQLFSGFEASDYRILFVNRDPAIFGDFQSLNADPDRIRIELSSSDFVLDQGFQSLYQNPEIFDRKYMVIRDENNRSDFSYIQMTLQ